MHSLDYYLWIFALTVGLIAWAAWSLCKDAAKSDFGKGFAKGFFNSLKK